MDVYMYVIINLLKYKLNIIFTNASSALEVPDSRMLFCTKSKNIAESEKIIHLHSSLSCHHKIQGPSGFFGSIPEMVGGQTGS